MSQYVSCFGSLAWHNRLARGATAPRRPINRSADNTLTASRERSKSIKSILLSNRSRSTPMPRTDRSVQRRSIPNKPKQTINNGGRLILILTCYWYSWLCEHTSAFKHGESNVFVFSCYFKYGGSKFLLVLLVTVTPPPAPDASGSSF